ncbi:MAG: polysaccharide deacetylase family protein [Betaproteobacteria bacterium]|nr:polysaccharide deacetylase family protein [Betaproteobacteria bacterium]
MKSHGRYEYSAIAKRRDYSWPSGKRLAVYLGFNLEHFHFGQGLGASLGPRTPEPDVLNYAWRDYGNRVGAWRCLELFDELKLPTGAIVNTSLYEYCPELVDAFHKRGDELIAHGHTNSERQGEMSEPEERRLLASCLATIRERSGKAPEGWLSPWISESERTPDLLAETGYRYTLNWCHDDQPTRFSTRSGELWSVPYPQELNDIPAIVARQMNAGDFADMIVDNFDEMERQSAAQPLVMGIALHPYIVGQPYRLRHLRRALSHVARSGKAWLTTPGAIYRHCAARA